MSLSRRKMLALIGGGTILAAGGASGAFVATRTPTRALRPWDLAGGYDDIRKNALSWALLAPNPHNLQPWQAELRGADEVVLWRDTARGLPATDPFDRQITIGMGCFLELMVLAAAEAGHAVDLTLFPDGEAGPVAQARFRPAAGQPDPLFQHALSRRSCKEPFEDREVPASLIGPLEAQVITEPARVDTLRALTWEAWLVEAMTPHTMQESIDLMRMGKREIEANPDGIDLGGPFLESLMLVGALSREAQMDPNSRSFRQGVALYKAMLSATPAYAVLTSSGNTRADQIAAGRQWLRLNLQTTAAGLALHPVSQCLQEYPEMAPHYARAHEMLAEPGETVQMLGRLGYGPQTPKTPRWPLEAKMMHG